MARQQLSKLNGQRLRFHGTFSRYGTKNGWQGAVEETILLLNICLVANGRILTDHLWFNHTKGFAALGTLAPGDCVAFTARVHAYRKGYRGKNWVIRQGNPPRTDWRLSRPTQIVKVTQETVQLTLLGGE